MEEHFTSRLVTILLWLVAITVFAQWFVRWRLAGPLSLQRFIAECRKLHNRQAFLFGFGVLSLSLYPIAQAFREVLKPVIGFVPQMIPAGLIAIFVTTGPVSFFVLGPSLWSTIRTAAKLIWNFPFLRTGAALNPQRLRWSERYKLGPSGNLWTSERKATWQSQVVRMTEDAPLIVFDGRIVSDHTCWEFFHLLVSSELHKVLVIGPVGETGIGEFLRQFEGIPVVEFSLVQKVLRASTRSRKHLAEWSDRRRHSILKALQRAQQSPRYCPPQISDELAPSFERFYRELPNLIKMYGELANSPNTLYVSRRS